MIDVVAIASLAWLRVYSEQIDTVSLLKQYPDSFVTRNGSDLILENNVIRLAGANIYWLGLDENGSPGIDYPTTFRVEDAILTASKILGSTLVRSHTLGISYGNPKSFEPTLNSFDKQIAINKICESIYYAKINNIRLIIPLTDNYYYYHGGEHTFTDWYNINNVTLFYYNQTVINAFKYYLNTLMNTYNNYTNTYIKNEPTILAFETGNEIYPPPLLIKNTSVISFKFEFVAGSCTI